MKLRVSARAKRDLAAIGEWIARDDPDRAVTFTDELLSTCQQLPDFPNAFPVVSAQRQLHRRNYRGHAIYYRSTPTMLTIVGIVHGARHRSGWR